MPMTGLRLLDDDVDDAGSDDDTATGGTAEELAVGFEHITGFGLHEPPPKNGIQPTLLDCH